MQHKFMEKKRFTIDIPLELHTEFKKIAVEQRITLKKMIEIAISKFVRDYQNLKMKNPVEVATLSGSEPSHDQERAEHDQAQQID